MGDEGRTESGREAQVDGEALIEAKDHAIQILEEQLREEREARRQADTIIAQLTQANAALAQREPELTATQEPPGASESAGEEPEGEHTPVTDRWRSRRRRVPALVEGGIRSMSTQTERLAYWVLEAANRTQGRGTTVRLVVPSAPEVTRELDPALAEHELLVAEEYLLERGHIAPAEIAGLAWGTYTITQAGLEWLEEGFSDEEATLESTLVAELEEERHQLDELERELEEARREPTVAHDTPGGAQAVKEGPGRAEPRSDTGGPQEASEPLRDTAEVPIRKSDTRRWWRRVFGE